MAASLLLYGYEHWILTKQQVERIETAEIRFLRGVAGYTLLDMRRNKGIRNDVKVFNLKEEITKYRRKWKGCVM